MSKTYTKNNIECFNELFGECASVGIAIIQNKRFKYVNKAFAESMGFTVAEVVNFSDKEFLNYVYIDDRYKCIELLETFERDEIIQYNFRALTKTGLIYHAEIFVKSIQYEGKLANFMTISAKDIPNDIETEKKGKELFINLLEKFLPSEVFCFYKSKSAFKTQSLYKTFLNTLINTYEKIKDTRFIDAMN